MKVFQAYRYELDTNNVQNNLLLQHAGCARFAYNWGLNIKQQAYQKTKKSPNAIQLHKTLNALKKSKFPWMYEVSKCAPQEALRNLDKAYQNFFRRVKNGEKPGFPKFKKKGIRDSFRLTGSVNVGDATHIKIPRIGVVKTKELTVKFKGKILSTTITRETDRWYIALQVEVERDVQPPSGTAELPYRQFGPVIGIDSNTGELVLFDGENERRIKLPKPLTKLLALLQKRSKAHSKKAKGSKNRKKSAIALSRLHRKIKNIRQDFFHKLSTELAKTTLAVGIESLCIKGMIRQPYLSRSIADAGWWILFRMLEYKSKWYGSILIEIPQNFPSTKMCHKCKHVVGEMPLGKRIFTCHVCSLVIDRDLNAAINIRNYAAEQLNQTGGEEVALSSPYGDCAIPKEKGIRKGTCFSMGIKIPNTASSAEINACGEAVQQGSSTKQEESALVTR